MKNFKNYLKLLAVIQLLAIICMLFISIFEGFEYFFHVWIRVASVVLIAFIAAPFFSWLIDKWID
jgi:hypothetical protein